MAQQSHRSARLEARLSPASLALVKRAAELQGRSVSDFVVAAAQEAAKRAVQEAQIVQLSLEDQRAVMEAILHPPPLAPAMKRAIKRYGSLIRQSE